jgi:hypothetical protein
LLRGAAFCQVRLEYLKTVLINFHGDKAVVLSTTDDVNHLAYGQRNGGLMIASVGQS